LYRKECLDASESDGLFLCPTDMLDKDITV
jgi:hypothetical protein